MVKTKYIKEKNKIHKGKEQNYNNMNKRKKKSITYKNLFFGVVVGHP
jgi:predicted porin